MTLKEFLQNRDECDPHQTYIFYNCRTNELKEVIIEDTYNYHCPTCECDYIDILMVNRELINKTKKVMSFDILDERTSVNTEDYQYIGVLYD